MEFLRFVVLVASVTIVVGQDERCTQDPRSRKECGYPGITPAACIDRGCCFDSNQENAFWCFQRRSQNQQTSSISQERSLPISYNGGCLFYCTSVAMNLRFSCNQSGPVTEEQCLRRGCCYDTRPDVSSTRRCYYPRNAEQACPAPQCQIPQGRMRSCSSFFSTRSCESRGCCLAVINKRRYCYRKEALPVTTTITTIPETTTEATSTTSQSTTSQSTTTTRPPTFVELIRQQNGGTLGGFSIYDILTKSLDELVNDGDSERRGFSLTTSTTTTIATTTRITTPTTTTAEPETMTVCSWFGGCRTVTASPNQEARSCEPTNECGQVFFYPGSTVPPNIPDFSDDQNYKKIVGGSRAHPFSHPWTAMFLKKEGERTFLCGATIICSHWLVTSAHCMNRQTGNTSETDLDAYYYTVYVGRYVGWKAKKYGKQVQVFSGREGIDYIETHEDFTPGVKRGVVTNDIALIRLKKPIMFNQYVQPACLPQVDSTEGRKLWASGWGITRDRGPDDSALKQVGVELLNRTVCVEQVPRFHSSNTTGLLCAGGEQYHDTCVGDSGGPLVGYKSLGRDRRGFDIRRWELVGITSLGSPSCNTLGLDQQPALYTDIMHYLPWIRRRTHYCCRED